MTTLHPHYIIEDLLGHGGFAKVYKATHKETARQVALKVLRTPEDVEPEVWARCMVRFEREAAALLALSSPNIAKVYEYSIDPDAPYLALEFIQGESLKHRIDHHGAIPVPQAIEITGQILQGLVHAHDAGLLHRDLKPANIMLEDALWQGRRVVLIDFGIVKSTMASGQDTTTGDRLLGTPRYMAPEQILGATIDERADLYSVGLVCVEMLSGQPVVKGTDAINVVAQHLMGELSIDLGGLALPQGLEAWLGSMIAKKASERFACARDALRALRDLHTEPGPLAPPLMDVTPLEQARPKQVDALSEESLLFPKRPSPFWIAAIAAGLMVLGVAGWWALQPPLPSPATQDVPLTAAKEHVPEAEPAPPEPAKEAPPAQTADPEPSPPDRAKKATRRRTRPGKVKTPSILKANEDPFEAVGISH